MVTKYEEKSLLKRNNRIIILAGKKHLITADDTTDYTAENSQHCTCSVEWSRVTNYTVYDTLGYVGWIKSNRQPSYHLFFVNIISYTHLGPNWWLHSLKCEAFSWFHFKEHNVVVIKGCHFVGSMFLQATNANAKASS